MKHFDKFPCFKKTATDLLQAEVERHSQINYTSTSSSAFIALQPVPFTKGDDDTAPSLSSEGNTTETKRKNILSLCSDKPRSLTSPSNESTSWMSSTITITDKDNDDILAFWPQHGHLFPIIAGIARVILANPASNIRIERLFSKSKNILTEKQASIGFAKTDCFLLLKKNLGVLKNVFDKNSTAGKQCRVKRKKNEQMKNLLDTNPKKAKIDETNQFLD